mmetsp:Transcript_28345/g.74410  ORF Transcript_28345/g.74410 Transcript_28345/m.74410 type:complete len:262 (+) Transcript_28345:1670-2455(+)
MSTRSRGPSWDCINWQGPCARSDSARAPSGWTRPRSRSGSTRRRGGPSGVPTTHSATRTSWWRSSCCWRIWRLLARSTVTFRSWRCSVDIHHRRITNLVKWSRFAAGWDTTFTAAPPASCTDRCKSWAKPWTRCSFGRCSSCAWDLCRWRCMYAPARWSASKTPATTRSRCHSTPTSPRRSGGWPTLLCTTSLTPPSPGPSRGTTKTRSSDRLAFATSGKMPPKLHKRPASTFSCACTLMTTVQFWSKPPYARSRIAALTS